MTTNEMAKEIQSWVISYAELAASMKTDDMQMINEAKMQACVQIAESCGLLDDEDAKELYAYGQDMTGTEIAARVMGVK